MCNAGDSGWEDSLETGLEWQPTPVLLSREFLGQRSLVGYSPWGRKELKRVIQDILRVKKNKQANTFSGFPSIFWLRAFLQTCLPGSEISRNPQILTPVRSACAHVFIQEVQSWNYESLSYIVSSEL